MVKPKPESFRVIEGDGASTTQDESPEQHVGAFLREARENTGRSVDDIASMLRIGAKFLKSIEDGRFEDLPGPTYAIGFIRSYADHLGLDTDALVDQFKSQSNDAERHSELEFPVPTTVGWFPTGKVVAICALLALAVFAGWFLIQTEDAIDVAAVPLPPGYTPAIDGQASDSEPSDPADADNQAGAQTAAAATGTEATGADTPAVADDVQETSDDGEKPYSLPVPVASLVLPDPLATEADLITAEPAEAEIVETPPSPTDPTTAAPAPVADTAATPDPVAESESVDFADDAAPAVADSDAEPQPAQVAALPAVPADSGSANVNGGGRTYGVINQEARVVIGAQADSWVQVQDDNQNIVLTRLLRPGDRYLVPDRPDLIMSTGNAGGLVISVDGAPVPNIGVDGDVLHNVRLDIELLKAGQAVVR